MAFKGQAVAASESWRLVLADDVVYSSRAIVVNVTDANQPRANQPDVRQPDVRDRILDAHQAQTVLVAGSSGLIGTALVGALCARGDRVIRLVRRPAVGAGEVSWDPAAGVLDASALSGVQAVVNLAGAGVGDHRWTDSYKREILDSRVNATSLLARTMTAPDGPRVLVNASAIGWYGDTGDRAVDEDAPVGSGFLAEVVRDWEAATEVAAAAGVRVVRVRTGLVVAKEGGAWARMFPLFGLGLGGRMGSGRQYWSWISLRDEIAALLFCLDRADVVGAVNATGPNPVTNAEVTAAMGRVMHRPTMLPVPGFALELALGEFSTEILSSARVEPRVLRQAGFTWSDPRIEDAIATALRG